MPLTKEEKDYIINHVIELLKSPNKDQLLENLREKVMNQTGDEETLDDAVYSVALAIQELVE